MTGRNQPVQKKQGSVNSLNITAEHKYSGPIPPPEMLSQYDLIVPGFADRILNMAEKESENRHNNESRVTKMAVRTTIMGMIFAFLSVVIVGFLVFYALYKGFDTAAGSIAVGTMAAVAGVFVIFKRSKRDLHK